MQINYGGNMGNKIYNNIELGQILNSPETIKEYELSNELEFALKAIQYTIITLNYESQIDPFENGGEQLTGDTFDIQAYSWSECDCEECWEKGWSEELCQCGWKPQEYNFYWKGTDDVEPIIVSWYKYFNRGSSCNREVTGEEAKVMLLDILGQLK